MQKQFKFGVLRTRTLFCFCSNYFNFTVVTGAFSSQVPGNGPIGCAQSVMRYCNTTRQTKYRTIRQRWRLKQFGNNNTKDKIKSDLLDNYRYCSFFKCDFNFFEL